MSAVFSAYIDEHATLCAAVGRSISALRSESDAAARRAQQAAAEADLGKADDIVQQMDLEARSAAKAEKSALQAKAKTCKSELAALRSSLKQAMCSLPLGADGQASSGDENADSNDQRARLLRMGERIHEGTSKLQQAQRTALETEAIGISILGDLRSQRETITHAAGTLQRANEGLLRSKKTLQAIGRRALANRLVMGVLIVLLGAAVLFLMYVELFGFGGGGGSSGGDDGGKGGGKGGGGKGGLR